MSDLYRHANTEDSMAVRAWIVPVEIDYEAAADAFNGEMLRITGNKAASVEMRAIHAAVDAAYVSS